MRQESHKNLPPLHHQKSPTKMQESQKGINLPQLKQSNSTRVNNEERVSSENNYALTSPRIGESDRYAAESPAYLNVDLQIIHTSNSVTPQKKELQEIVYPSPVTEEKSGAAGPADPPVKRPNSFLSGSDMLNIPSGDFQNDQELNPMGLPQKLLEDCFKVKTEINSRINYISNRITKVNNQKENNFALTVEQQTPRPLNPDCVIQEDDFSPLTPDTRLNQGDTTAISLRDRELKRRQQQSQMSNFSSAAHSSQAKVSHLEVGHQGQGENGRSTSRNAAERLGKWSVLRNTPSTDQQSIHRSDYKRHPSPVDDHSPEKVIHDQFNVDQKKDNDQSHRMNEFVTQAPRNNPKQYTHEEIKSIVSQIKRQSAEPRIGAPPPDETYQVLYDQETEQRRARNLSMNPSQGTVRVPTPVSLAPLLHERPSKKRGKKTLVLDLDETLVHSQFKPVVMADIVLTIDISNNPSQVLSQKVYACKRPFCDKFLEAVSPHFEIVMFTASLSRYAEPLFKKLDPTGKLIDTCLYREHCTQFKKDFYVKDLTRLNRPIEDIIIIDNSPNSYLFQPQNALPCVSWYDNPNDTELNSFIPILEKLARYKGDVRRVLRKMMPRNFGNKVDPTRANKVLDRALLKQVHEYVMKPNPTTTEVIVEEKEMQSNSDKKTPRDAMIIDYQQHQEVNKANEVTFKKKNLKKEVSSSASRSQEKSGLSIMKLQDKSSLLLMAPHQGKKGHGMVHHTISKLNDSQQSRQRRLQQGGSSHQNSRLTKIASTQVAQKGASEKFLGHLPTSQTERPPPAQDPQQSSINRSGKLNLSTNAYYSKVMSDIKIKDKIMQSQVVLGRVRQNRAQATSEANQNSRKKSPIDSATPSFHPDPIFNREKQLNAYQRKQNDTTVKLGGTSEQHLKTMVLNDRRTPDLKPAISLVAAESIFDGNMTTSPRFEDNHGNQVVDTKQGGDGVKNSRNMNRAAAMLHSHHQKTGSNVVLRPSNNRINVQQVDLVKVNRSSEQEPRYASQPRTKEEIPLVSSIRLPEGTLRPDLVPKLNLGTRNKNCTVLLPNQLSHTSRMSMGAALRTELPNSILQSLSGTRNYAQVQATTNIKVEQQVLHPFSLAQMTSFDLRSNHQHNQEKQRKFSQQVDQLNRETEFPQKSSRFIKKHASMGQKMPQEPQQQSRQHKLSILQTGSTIPMTAVAGGHHSVDKAKEKHSISIGARKLTKLADQILAPIDSASYASSNQLQPTLVPYNATTTTHLRHRARLEQNVRKSQGEKPSSKSPPQQATQLTKKEFLGTKCPSVSHMLSQQTLANNHLYQLKPMTISTKYINKVQEVHGLNSKGGSMVGSQTNTQKKPPSERRAAGNGPSVMLVNSRSDIFTNGTIADSKKHPQSLTELKPEVGESSSKYEFNRLHLIDNSIKKPLGTFDNTVGRKEHQLNQIYSTKFFLPGATSPQDRSGKVNSKRSNQPQTKSKRSSIIMNHKLTSTTNLDSNRGVRGSVLGPPKQ